MSRVQEYRECREALHQLKAERGGAFTNEKVFVERRASEGTMWLEVTKCLQTIELCQVSRGAEEAWFVEEVNGEVILCRRCRRCRRHRRCRWYRSLQKVQKFAEGAGVCMCRR